jgi:hypothetical protein
MRKAHVFGVLALSVLAAAGCASAPTVRVDKDPAVDLSSYKTFGYFDQVATDRSQYSSLATTHLKQATTAELQRLGYVYDERNAQLRVNFFLKVADRQEIRSTPSAGFYRARFGIADIETRNYKAGTLGVDLVDTGRAALVWQGVAEGRLKDKAARDSGAAIRAAVAEIFRNFPSAPVS